MGDESLRFVLASLAFALQEALFPPHSRFQDFLSSLQTHIHMQTSLASFILNTSRIILREHTLLMHGLLLVPHLHSPRHSTPRPFGHYFLCFLYCKHFCTNTIQPGNQILSVTLCRILITCKNIQIYSPTDPSIMATKRASVT